MGKTIKQVREALGFKQCIIAERLGISSRQLQRIENEEHPVKQVYLEELAKIFNVDVAELQQYSKEGGFRDE